jgi:MFS family permease
MLSVLKHPTYRHLFYAQVIALIGTGLATVALGLLAYDIAGADAGLVLGSALAIKMLAYIGIAPIASAFAQFIPRRSVLVSLDIVRALIALLLPFVTQVWEIYVLIFVLNSASAAFTPTFQATITDILPDEKDYTKALVLSRLAYDLESLLSPGLAFLLLTVISYNNLFTGTAVGFIASAALVLSVMLPKTKTAKNSIYGHTTKGLRIYFTTPRLKGLLTLNLAIAAGSAMVIVNTVVLVQSSFSLSQSSTALALVMFGAGSMLVALLLPILLLTLPEKRVMLVGAGLTALALLFGFFAAKSYMVLLPLWFVLGLGYSMAQTPSSRLVRRSAKPEDRPSLFAAQFALSHACWLITYPLAGWLGSKAGMGSSFLALGGISLVSIVATYYFWREPEEVPLVPIQDDFSEKQTDEPVKRKALKHSPNKR